VYNQTVLTIDFYCIYKNTETFLKISS